MTVVSKQLFYEKISKEVTCREIHYWSDSCVGAQVWLFDVFFGVLKFYLPIYMVSFSILLNHYAICLIIGFPLQSVVQFISLVSTKSDFLAMVIVFILLVKKLIFF